MIGFFVTTVRMLQRYVIEPFPSVCDMFKFFSSFLCPNWLVCYLNLVRSPISVIGFFVTTFLLYVTYPGNIAIKLEIQ